MDSRIGRIPWIHPNPTFRRVAALVVAALCAACSKSTSPIDNASANLGYPPQARYAAASANQYSVLSSVVTFLGTLGDSARVISVAPGDSSATPFVSIQSDPVAITTLGLLPATTYKEIVQVKNAQGTSAEDTVDYTTAALPSYVQRAKLTQTSGAFSGGYTLLNPIGYTADTALAVAFDSLDRVRWYRMFPGYASTEIKQQPNSHFTIYLNTINYYGSDSANSTVANGAYVEFLPTGDSLRSYAAPAAAPMDAHELWLTGGSSSSPGTAHFFAYDNRQGNVSAIGGPDSSILVGGHQIYRTGPTGAVEFSWDSWDHFVVTDCLFPWSGADGDFDHPNSLEFDLDSNYIVSFRNLSAMLKLDYNTGAVIWRLGGTHNQFQILNDPQALAFGPTSGQHSVRVLPNGHLLIYDDGDLLASPHSRAVEYALDLTAKTATMVWEYLPTPSIYTAAVGSVQRLANGNTLVGFGFAGQLHEVGANSVAVGKATFTLNGVSEFYRAVRLPSLYTYVPQNGR